jgi:hypothetical protein
MPPPRCAALRSSGLVMKAPKRSAFEVRHRVVGGDVAHHDLRLGMTLAKGGDELVGQLARLDCLLLMLALI